MSVSATNLPPVKVAVVTVSYNTRDLLRNCLASIRTTTRNSEFCVETVVVDNASHDGSAEMVAAEFPEVQLLLSDLNLGFAGGNNLAIQTLGFEPTVDQLRRFERSYPRSEQPHADRQPDFVLLLNSDAELTAGALVRMVRVMQETPSVGACGAHLEYGDGTFQHGAFGFPTLAQVAIDFFPLARMPGVHRLHNSRLNGRYSQLRWEGATPFEVGFVLGAAMLVRGAAIRQVGVLDEGYFMYCEEMDWSMRLTNAGWRIFAVPTARVIHHEGQSSRKVRWQAFEWLWRSRFRFYRIHRARYPRGYLAALRALVRVSLKDQARQAHRRFARGEIDGGELQEQLAAYAAVARM